MNEPIFGFLFKVTLSLLFMLILLLNPAASAAQNSLEFGGYYKNFFVIIDQPDYRNQPAFIQQKTLGLVTNRVRLELSADLTDDLSLNTAYTLVPRIQDPSFFSQDPFVIAVDPSRYRFSDFRDRIYPDSTDQSESFGLYHNLDRAYLSLALPFADLYVGRQAIAWGSAKVINPLDVIAPFTFNELDTEERIGVDAVRLRIPIGFMGEIDAGYVTGKDMKYKNSAAFLRGKTYVMQTDISAMAALFRENLMVGADLARSLGGAGVWLEAAYVFINPFKQNRPTGYDYFRGAAGADYSFSDGTYAFLEVHYSEAGVEEPMNYLWNFIQHPAFSEGAVYMLGQKYVIPGIVHQITPLISLQGQVIYNVDDRSVFAAPMLEYNIAQDIYLGAGAFLGMGKRPEYGGIGTGQPFQVFRSEFGGYPDLLFSTFRVYF